MDTENLKVQLSYQNYPDPCHRLNRLLVLPQRADVRLLLKDRRVVVNVQHVDADPPRGFLPAAVSRQHGQREAPHQLVVQTGPQNDPAGLLIQREPKGGNQNETMKALQFLQRRRHLGHMLRQTTLYCLL